MGHIGDLARFEEPAAPLDVGHDEIDGAFFKQFAEAVAEEEVLAGADGGAHGLSDVAQGVAFFGGTGSSSQRMRKGSTSMATRLPVVAS